MSLWADGEVVQWRRLYAEFVDRCLSPCPACPSPPVNGSTELLEASVSVVDARREEVTREGWDWKCRHVHPCGHFSLVTSLVSVCVLVGIWYMCV